MENGHAICIPFPAHGHIRPMLKLAQALHSHFSFHITFVTIHPMQQTFTSLFNNYKLPNFSFVSIGDENTIDDTKDIMSIIKAVLENRLEEPLREYLVSSSGLDGNVSRPRVTCMISDVTMTCFTLPVAREIGIPATVLDTTSSCAILAYLHFPQLVDKGIIPLPDTSCLTNGYLEKLIDGMSSMKGIRLKDMPTSLRTTNQDDILLNAIISNAQRALKCEAILTNTFDSLEQDVLNDLSTFSRNIYPIGPLHLLSTTHVDSKSTNEEDNLEYMQWLDLQESNSVLYVSFGSLAVMTQDQLLEFVWGLANSHQKFLWVIRDDLVKGHAQDAFSLELVRKIESSGLLVSWCDQQRVLNHQAIGGFLTHCGWNSMIESVSNGVSVICWPPIADQVTNCWYFCHCLGIGLKLSEEVERGEVEKAVNELMEGMIGKEMKKKSMELKRLAREATMSPHGSSYLNLEKVVNNVLHPPKQ